MSSWASYQLEYRNKYNVEWRKVLSSPEFETKREAAKARHEKAMNAPADADYRIVKVTREVVE